jgi:hypothetical protein
VVLHVDDFGCVPDGRFLEQVSIDPGSAVLNVPGGGLRSTDTGKNVAVPGAVDLVATIGLAKLREVKNASMTLDDPTRLTGTLIDPAKPAGKQEEDFVAAAHEGRRITVAGAGPGGQSLLTNVVDVVDATTVLLADAASTAVAAEDNAEVILNDPAVAVLSNYARRPVADLTVDLGDRSIDDGEMSSSAAAGPAPGGRAPARGPGASWSAWETPTAAATPRAGK